MLRRCEPAQARSSSNATSPPERDAPLPVVAGAQGWRAEDFKLRHGLMLMPVQERQIQLAPYEGREKNEAMRYGMFGSLGGPSTSSR